MLNILEHKYIPSYKEEVLWQGLAWASSLRKRSKLHGSTKPGLRLKGLLPEKGKIKDGQEQKATHESQKQTVQQGSFWSYCAEQAGPDRHDAPSQFVVLRNSLGSRPGLELWHSNWRCRRDSNNQLLKFAIKVSNYHYFSKCFKNSYQLSFPSA